MKKLLGILLLSSIAAASADPYVEYKNEIDKLDLGDFSYNKSTNFLRLGYQWEEVFAQPYFEIGPMTDGYAWEAGYKIKIKNNLVWKGKLETKDANGPSATKLETEIRYTFK